jgi:hypothetical protein
MEGLAITRENTVILIKLEKAKLAGEVLAK